MKNKKIIGVIATLIVVIVIVIAVIVISSMNYRNKTITASNYETIISEAKDSDLTDEEKAQFASGLLKYAFNQSGTYGKKVKDIIEEGKGLIGDITNNKDDKKTTDARTMEEFVQKFKDNDYEIDLNEKPIYAMIGASDGIIFYIDNSPVKIYKYSSEESYDKAKKDYSFLKECKKNGLFILETNSKKAEEIFEQIQ